ncbi:MAG TPA: caspase family protein [Terracidiphilus sp.]|nr:caspase family protein [Terracidiphilus sp.]
MIGAPPAARAADDTARFFGQWKIIVSGNGQTVVIISVHDSDGFKNYVQTPSGFLFAGSGAFSASNGIWFAAAPPPNNGGTYHFVNVDTVVCNNALGQTVTWRRDKTPLGPASASHAQPEPAEPQPSRPSSHDTSVPSPDRHKRGLSAESETDQGPIQPGNNFALVIGIDDYPAPLPKLKTAVNDAKSFAGLLTSKYGFQVTTLLNQDATRDKILGAITHFRKSLAENDSFLIYYAGHGSFDRATDKGYWLPVDADSDPLITSRDISADDLITEVRGLAARHVIIISDSCFSGDLTRDAGDFSPSDGNQAYIHRMQRAPSRTLMASGSDEPVSDSGSQGHSVFAALLLQAMQSRGGQTFTADDLFVSIRKGVLARSGQSPQYSPLRGSIRPSASLDTGDFVFSPKGSASK